RDRFFAGADQHGAERAGSGTGGAAGDEGVAPAGGNGARGGEGKVSGAALAGGLERGEPRRFGGAQSAAGGFWLEVLRRAAHLGSFELGAAMLAKHERRIHVVFRRDRHWSFEQMRSEQRARLGIVEAPLDDGWDIWLRLREALLADEAVLLQGDRVLPGQRG